MKVIIAGSRDCEDYPSLLAAIRLSMFDITEVVSGHARGVDQMGERWAEEHGIPVKLFPAEWGKYGKSAGPKRNLQMAEYSDAAILLWDGMSRGTRSMRDIATSKGLTLFVQGIRGYNPG
jgi:hypothetical protein